MKKCVWLAPCFASVALAVGADYHYDLARLFPSEQAERFERAKVLERLDAIEHEGSPLESSAALLQWLTRYDDILRGLRKHEAYVYMRAERDNEDPAADLDRLASAVLPRFATAAGFDRAMRVSWARNRLYFTDPLYSTNYLFAELLALNYFGKFEADAKGFSQRYVALLKNGMTDTPQRLLRTMVAIDLDDAPGLVKGATAVLSQRIAAVEVNPPPL